MGCILDLSIWSRPPCIILNSLKMAKPSWGNTTLFLSCNPITHLVSFFAWFSLRSCLDCLVFLMDPSVSSHFFWNFDGETDFPHDSCLYIPAPLLGTETITWQTPILWTLHCNLYPPVSWLSLHHGLMCSWHHPPHPRSMSYIQCSSPMYLASTWTFDSTFILVTYNDLWYFLQIHHIQSCENDNYL